MSILPETTNYTDQDFESWRRRAFDLVQTVYPDWTDESPASIGNILIELLAHAADLLSFMINAEGAEAHLGTATRRESIIALGRLVGYELATASAATADVTVTLDAPADAPISIPAGTVVRTADRLDVVRFRLLAALTIDTGESSGTATVENAEPRTKSLEATGQPNLDVLLDQTPYLDGSVTVSTSDQGAFSEVDSLVSSAATDLDFAVLVDARDRATIRFGDGVNGAPPSGTVTITYKTGGGAAGNVDANQIMVLEASIVDAGGATVRGSITNPLAASGGADRETLEAARLEIPAFVRSAGERSVTVDDFELGARLVPGVARALMLTSDDDAAVAENSGLILVVPDGGGTATQAVLDAVVTMVTVTRPTMPTFDVTAISAIYVEVDVYVRAFFRSGYTPATVAAAIRSALAAHFDILDSSGAPNASIDFGARLDGGLLAWSDAFDVVRDLPGVQRIRPLDFKIADVADDFTIAAREFPILGDVTIIDGDTGAAL